MSDLSDETQKIDPASDTDKTVKIELLQETKRNLNAGKIVFSRFELLRELGSGGMGVVWLAKDLEVEGRVALKFLPGLVRDPIAERDLRDEVKNARDLVHENIVSVRTLHKDDSSIAVEMEYVDGPNVSVLMRDTTNRFLDVDKAADIVRGLCLAIDYAWTPPRKVVHRDIKPANMLVTAAGNVKVVDFGIAHTVSETITRLTGQSKSERVVGTLPYMSPQQLKGEVRHHNDVYAIGATIYHILTGTAPFRATDAAVLTQQINGEVPVTMAERRRQLVNEGRKITGALPIPKIWEEVVAACLAKDPAKRPANARQIAERLGLLETAPKPRSLSLIFTAIAGLALMGGGLFYYYRDAGDKPPPVPQVPVITAQPADKTVLEGAPVEMAVTATGATPLSFEWRQNGTVIPGANTSSYSIASASPANAGNYEVIVKNTYGQAVSSAAQITLSKTPVPAPVPLNPAPVSQRENWQLVAGAEPIRVHITNAADGAVEFDGTLPANAKKNLPCGKPLLVELKGGSGLGWEIDGHRLNPPLSQYGRWVLNVPTNATGAPSITVPEPPFQEQVGPLQEENKINQPEADWIRSALAGEKGNDELKLVRELCAKDNPITIGQWRARTALKFKPDVSSLSTDAPRLLIRGIDLVLPPGGEVMRLLRIEPGQYRRGSLPSEKFRLPNDSAAGNVTIAKPFFIGIFEVTQGQYKSVLKRNPSDWHLQSHLDWPVDRVTWKDLKDNGGFLTKLNSELSKLYGGLLVADLPTDDEWEYACRAGSTTTFYTGADISDPERDPTLDKIAQYRPSNNPAVVGSHGANAWGLSDMLGNLEEWTQNTNLRGGSWNAKAIACRAAALKRSTAYALSSNEVGFRLVLRFRENK